MSFIKSTLPSLMVLLLSTVDASYIGSCNQSGQMYCLGMDGNDRARIQLWACQQSASGHVGGGEAFTLDSQGHIRWNGGYLIQGGGLYGELMINEVSISINDALVFSRAGVSPRSTAVYLKSGGKCLGVEDGVYANKNGVQMQPCNWSRSQQWEVHNNGNAELLN